MVVLYIGGMAITVIFAVVVGVMEKIKFNREQKRICEGHEKSFKGYLREKREKEETEKKRVKVIHMLHKRLSKDVNCDLSDIL